ncbi:phosphatase PAP2 family protein [Hymenobacter sp. BT175]|uniref:phosphatase PAP2 family protein n=1 Tax=Hymenobacter translucens TaxID=2886507 RepID=UPI001D0EDE17|nr:phosphatase PAP2 family protein [Hymenobacter translucens]MCC2548590.1 phosphatase PAP2 family protein [Hymenobacter translucens]
MLPSPLSAGRQGPWLVPALSLAYLLFSYFLIGFRPEQLVLVGLCNACYFLSDTTRRFITGFSIFVVFWILYDYMRAFPNYAYRAVDVAGLYHTEKSLFGISHLGRVVTPNEFWLLHHTAWLDVLCGIFYLCWVPIPLAFAGYLFFKNRPLFFAFALTFLLVNILGFVVYYLHPAAPPWYVQQHGLQFQPLTMGSTAGLARFDRFFGVSIFQGIYAKNANIFAAMPSLHSAYPAIVLFYAIKNRSGLFNAFFLVVMLGIWFAAVYTSHHYVLDVLAGISIAITGIGIIRLLLAKSRLFNRFIAAFLRATASSSGA